MKLSQKLLLLVWPTIYFVLIITICISGALAFNRTYYSLIFVSGTSMLPTLNDLSLRPSEFQTLEYVDYGKIDNHESAIKKLKRFDIVTTYYPWDDKDYAYTKSSYIHNQKPLESASYKIKRVIAFPFETVKIDCSTAFKETFTIYPVGEMQLVYTNDNCPFERKREGNNPYRQGAKFTITLDENEYFVMGDNWSTANSSSDCLSNQAPIYRENITGVLVSIDGFAKSYAVYYHYCSSCKKIYSKDSTVNICPECGQHLDDYKKDFIKDLHKRKTRYF